MKTIEFNPLSRKSVLHAKREVLRYRKDLEQKFEKFVNELKNTGFDILNAKISAIPPVYRGDIIPHVELGGSQGKYTIKLIISGSDVAFVEFGTGITFNGSAGSSPHPKGAEMGMLIGEYGKSKVLSLQVGFLLINMATWNILMVFLCKRLYFSLLKN